MTRLYAGLLGSALLIAGVVLYEVWTGGAMPGEVAFRLIASAGVTMLFLSFVAIVRLDFANFESRRLAYAILGLAYGLEGLALLGIWDVWTPDGLFTKVAVTLGVLLGLCLYILSLREDFIREKRMKDHDYLD